jgi:hypothetical protein
MITHFMTLVVMLFLGGLLVSRAVGADQYDESKAGTFTLPDPLLLNNGQRVTDAETWFKQRRPEIYSFFENEFYGRVPPRPAAEAFDLHDNDSSALDGKAIRKQITIRLNGRSDGPNIDVLMYLPAKLPRPVPVFLCLSFTPLQQINADPGIKLMDGWDTKGKKRAAADPGLRGRAAVGWPVEEILARGYGIAVIYYCQIEPDFAGGVQFGVRAAFSTSGAPVAATNPADAIGPSDWGAVAAWGWGASRVMDYLETDADVDSKHVALMGHSRLGKTVCWAGARDQRFAMILAAQSGRGGASLARRNYGETLLALDTNFGYQFCANLKKYAADPNTLPVDSHELLALIAPRPLYQTTSVEDRHSDPRGEFLAAVAASPVFDLLGARGLVSGGLDPTQLPPVDTSTMRTQGFHYRSGKHAVTAYDWDRFLDFADLHFKTKTPR